MVNWLTLLAHKMLPNQGLSPGLGQGLVSTQDEYQSPNSYNPQLQSSYNPRARSLFPVSSSNPILNNRMMIMMMIEKMRATKVSLDRLNAKNYFQWMLVG